MRVVNRRVRFLAAFGRIGAPVQRKFAADVRLAAIGIVAGFGAGRRFHADRLELGPRLLALQNSALIARLLTLFRLSEVRR